jgi:hypothetical protein
MLTILKDGTRIILNGQDETTWGEFLADNQFTRAEVREFDHQLLARGECRGGGGAQPGWHVEVASWQ